MVAAPEQRTEVGALKIELEKLVFRQMLCAPSSPERAALLPAKGGLAFMPPPLAARGCLPACRLPT
ncbi:MAG: hypothetical protein VYA84_06745 [Planctomycetota bacterium]|nr:hypothetical protein [Planctomycetota bacterium]